jgi:tetratricopeptide (TPR) repeat protein
MTQPRRFPYGSVPVYNPQSLSREEAIAQFHARQALYRSLLDLLREARPSHVLLIGTRGMGKTTLLQRIRFGVEESPDLNCRYLVLSFPEEQYNVNRLHHFLLNTVDALADTLEQIGDTRTLAQVEDFVSSCARVPPEEIEAKVPKFLGEVGERLHRGFLLLVDNADRLFETIEDREQWRLREILSSRSDLTFFGATTQASDGIYGPTRAFYEFFKVSRLTPLSLEEVKSLLLRLSDAVEDKSEPGTVRQRMQDWLDSDPARLRTLVQLTGGNPRTTVLLFHLVLDGLEGGAREYLEQLLDQCTPNYKGRIDDLPPQAQQVLDAIALRWDPATAHEIAEVTGLETGAVSTQLTRLVRQGILEKVDLGDSKRALYQVAERFFNIWYLMRASRRVRTRLRWFVEFLRVFYDSGELDNIAWERMNRLRGAGWGGQRDFENLFAFVIASGENTSKFEEFLRRECPDRERDWAPFFASVAVSECAEDSLTEEFVRLTRAVNAAKDEAKAAQSYLDTLRQRLDLVTEGERLARELVSKSPGSVDALLVLSAILSLHRNYGREAEATLREAIQLNREDARPWAILGHHLTGVAERRPEAEEFFRRAAILTDHAANWAILGIYLSSESGREADAETVLRRALQIDPTCVVAWLFLGKVLGDTYEADEALRRVTDLDPGDSDGWALLAALQTRGRRPWDEVQASLESAVQADTSNPKLWRALGLSYALTGKPNDAEEAFRKSIELRGDTETIRTLGVFLFCEQGKADEGIQYLRQAIQPDRSDSLSRGVAQVILAACLGQNEPGDSPAEDSRCPEFWDEIAGLCENYAPFGRILCRLCDLIESSDEANLYAPLFRAVAMAQLNDFPRAIVALEDALVGDPIDLLQRGRKALEIFFAAAVRHGRTKDTLELIRKKDWVDAWRPIYEALRAVGEGSANYLKKVAVEIRDPAVGLLRRIAPELPGLAEPAG